MKNPFHLLTLLPLCLLTLFTSCHKEFPTFTVTFNANDGVGTMPKQTFTDGEAQTLTLNSFTHSTLQFNGWATSATGAVVYTNGQSITINSNLTLYAKWYFATGTPCPGIPTVTDCQGNVYNTVLIGTQCWTRENLKATKYDSQSERPNETLPYGVPSNPYWSYYMPSTLSHADAGLLYNWAAAVGLVNGQSQSTSFTTDRQGICPNGWHMPNDGDWSIMQNYLIDNGFNWDGSTTENKISKSLVEVSPGNKGSWNNSSYNWDGLPGNTTDNGEPKRNLSGFSAVPAGELIYDNVLDAGNVTRFLSSAVREVNTTYLKTLGKNIDFLHLSNGGKDFGYSVRCIKN